MKATPKECADVILETTPLVTRAMRAAVAQYVGSGTTLPQFRVLSHLNRGSRCLSDLAVRQHVSLATMSKIVTGLVERGYVRRASESRDRRYISLRLTPKGQRFFDKTNAHSHREIAARIESLSSDERGRIVEGLRVIESVFKESEHHRRDETPAHTERKSK